MQRKLIFFTEICELPSLGLLLTKGLLIDAARRTLGRNLATIRIVLIKKLISRNFYYRLEAFTKFENSAKSSVRESLDVNDFESFLSKIL